MLSSRDSDSASHVILMNGPISGPLVFTSFSTLLGTEVWVKVKFCHYSEIYWSCEIWVYRVQSVANLQDFLVSSNSGYSQEDARYILPSFLVEMSGCSSEETQKKKKYITSPATEIEFLAPSLGTVGTQPLRKTTFPCPWDGRYSTWTKRFKILQWRSLELLNDLGQQERITSKNDLRSKKRGGPGSSAWYLPELGSGILAMI